MIKKLIVAATLMLSGCVWQTANRLDLDMATKYCKAENAELFSISPNVFGSWSAECNNGSIFTNRGRKQT